MTGTRTLFLHAGGGKAGSSAIQSALGSAAPKLLAEGISYANAPKVDSPYSITSGNGFPLYEALMEKNWKEVSNEFIESYFQESCSNAICSSEYFGSLPISCWNLLLDSTNKLNIQIRIIYFVRSPAGYLTAGYNQDVKRGGEHRTIEEFVLNSRWQHYNDLKGIRSTFPREAISVVNFDLNRKRIIRALSECWPELNKVAELIGSEEYINVNRSLNDVELEILRSVNKRFGITFSQELSDLIIYNKPDSSGTIYLSKALSEKISKKYSDEISWINEEFFGKADQKISGSVIAQKAMPVDPTEVIETQNVVLEWALGHLSASQEQALSLIFSRLWSIDWKNADRGEVPKDFDPIAYLLLNRDVLRAGIPPFTHYISSGHAEARRYKWSMADFPGIDEALKPSEADGLSGSVGKFRAEQIAEDRETIKEIRDIVRYLSEFEFSKIDQIFDGIGPLAPSHSEIISNIEFIRLSLTDLSDRFSPLQHELAGQIQTAVSHLTDSLADHFAQDGQRTADQSAQFIETLETRIGAATAQIIARTDEAGATALAQFEQVGRDLGMVAKHVGKVETALTETLDARIRAAVEQIIAHADSAIATAKDRREQVDLSIRRSVEETSASLREALAEQIGAIAKQLADSADDTSSSLSDQFAQIGRELKSADDRLEAIGQGLGELQRLPDALQSAQEGVTARAAQNLEMFAAQIRQAVDDGRQDLAHLLQSEFNTQREAQAALREELATRNELLDSYRRASLWQFLRWTLSARQRP